MTHILLSPLTWLLLIVLVLLARGHRLPRLPKALLLLSCAGLLLLCMPLGANLLVRGVESGLPQVARCQVPPGAPVVVLSGGFERRPRARDDFAALGAESWRRLRAGSELRQQQGGRLIVLGGGPHATGESSVLAALAESWGVPATAIVAESASQTTWENADGLRTLAAVDGDGIADGARFWLVSSALHLPRAVRAFGYAGFQPCAYASGSDYVAPGGVGYFIPQASAIDKSRRALHEAVGSLAYAVRHRRQDRRD